MKTIPGASHREDLPVPVPEAAYNCRLPGYLCLLFLYQNNNGNDRYNDRRSADDRPDNNVVILVSVVLRRTGGSSGLGVRLFR